jgi:hypothetical protein
LANFDSPKTESSVTARLSSATAELQVLEEQVKSGNLDPRVLREFRNAVDHIRSTAWAVQQWMGLEQTRQDPYSLLPAMAAERVRRATQLCEDLRHDLANVDIGIETPGMAELFRAIEELHQQLTPLFKKDS